MVNPIVKQRKRTFNSKRPSVSPRFAKKIPSKLLPLVAKYARSLVIFLIVIFGVRYILGQTVLSSIYTIQEVKYDSGSVAAYDNPYLYKALHDYLQGKNVYLQKHFHKKTLLTVAREVFPLVSDVEIFYLDEYTAAIRLSFDTPQMLFTTSGSTFGVYEDTTFPLQEDSTLSEDLLHVDLPDYLGNPSSLEGIFYQVPPYLLMDQLVLIRDYFTEPQRIVYLPGSARTWIVTADSRNIYINNLQDVSSQLQKIDRLKRYYPSFDVLREMDLGSLEDNKIIVRQ